MLTVNPILRGVNMGNKRFLLVVITAAAAILGVVCWSLGGNLTGKKAEGIKQNVSNPSPEETVQKIIRLANENQWAKMQDYLSFKDSLEMEKQRYTTYFFNDRVHMRYFVFGWARQTNDYNVKPRKAANVKPRKAAMVKEGNLEKYVACVDISWSMKSRNMDKGSEVKKGVDGGAITLIKELVAADHSPIWTIDASGTGFSHMLKRYPEFCRDKKYGDK